CQQSNSWPQTF
nr:immunoglobulin light chain junction region [Mus musculus]NSM00355.1 immunoglobulin light chain junction region [Mus musculus]